MPWNGGLARVREDHRPGRRHPGRGRLGGRRGPPADAGGSPFLDIQAWAFAHEREPLDAVELAWRQRLDSVRQPPWDRRPRVRTLVEAAFDQPALRRLTPVTSHYILWFSSSPSLPYARVGCSIDPHHNGKYGVRDRGEIVARTDTAEEAVALAVAALPPHLRSAD